MTALLKAIDKLRQQAGGKLAASLLTAAQKKALDDFSRRTDCIRCETAGRGVVYRVVNTQALENQWRTLCPVDANALSESLPQRAFNIASRRSSKEGTHRHQHYYLLLKAMGDGVSWQNKTTRLDLSRATRDFGAASLMIQAEDVWSSEQPLWLVENQALFDQLCWFPDQIASSIAWYPGQLNNLLLDWLSSKQRASRVILFADYDGVGLMNFARLQSRLGERCEFWLMPDYLKKLASFGNNKLWCDTLGDFQAAFSRLQSDSSAELLELMNAMQSTAQALEQEAVWIDSDEQA